MRRRRAVAVSALVLVAAGVGSAARADTPVSGEWWLPVVGTTGLTPPGPGKPVIIVDLGLDLGHPDFAHRPDTTALNRQTFTGESDDGVHATALASHGRVPRRRAGPVCLYPLARLCPWDSCSGGTLAGLYVRAGERS